MASMSTEERIQAVSQFLLQSPPGEINDVLNGAVNRLLITKYSANVCTCGLIDVRTLIGDDESLENGVLPALQQYNLEQFTIAEVPGAGHAVRNLPFVVFIRR